MRKTTGIPYDAEGAGIPVQRFRDVLKSVTAMEDDHRVYLLLAIEAQSEVHHVMPVRNMVYDALQYAAQVEETARAHRSAKKAATVISTVTGVEFEMNEEEEKVDMCEGMRGLLEDANKEGMQNERVAMAKRMLDEGSSSINFIAQMTGLSVDEVQELATERG